MAASPHKASQNLPRHVTIKFNIRGSKVEQEESLITNTVFKRYSLVSAVQVCEFQPQMVPYEQVTQALSWRPPPLRVGVVSQLQHA